MFIVSLTYVCDMSEIEKYLDEHIKFLDHQYSEGNFLASGRKVPRTGGIILAVSENRETLEKILSDDPFKIHNLAHYEITEFIPTKTSDPLSFLRPLQKT